MCDKAEQNMPGNAIPMQAQAGRSRTDLRDRLLGMEKRLAEKLQQVRAALNVIEGHPEFEHIYKCVQDIY